ncbi:MAG: hypothetical protein WEA24_10855 [Gemmatimonadota bacterium]
MLGREEARRLLQERSETWPGATDVTRVTRTVARGGEPSPPGDLESRSAEIVAHQNAAEYEVLTLLAAFPPEAGAFTVHAMDHLLHV